MAIGEIGAGYMNAADVYSTVKNSHINTYRQILESKMDAAASRVETGEEETPIRLGADSYTQSEWNAMLDYYDATLEDVREQMRAEHKKQYEQLLQKKAEDAVIEKKELQKEEYEKSVYEDKLKKQMELKK